PPMSAAMARSAVTTPEAVKAWTAQAAATRAGGSLGAPLWPFCSASLMGRSLAGTRTIPYGEKKRVGEKKGRSEAAGGASCSSWFRPDPANPVFCAQGDGKGFQTL